MRWSAREEAGQVRACPAHAQRAAAAAEWVPGLRLRAVVVLPLPLPGLGV